MELGASPRSFCDASDACRAAAASAALRRPLAVVRRFDNYRLSATHIPLQGFHLPTSAAASRTIVLTICETTSLDGRDADRRHLGGNCTLARLRRSKQCPGPRQPTYQMLRHPVLLPVIRTFITTAAACRFVGAKCQRDPDGISLMQHRPARVAL